ncbi:MAG: hypothetical protein ACK42D_02585 [Candidatus Paceibacteria bacterium]
MKKIYIVLAGSVILAIAVVFFVANNSSNSIDVVNDGNNQPSTNSSMGYTCNENDDYLVVTEQGDLADNEARLVVYQKSALPESVSCSLHLIEPVLEVEVEATSVLEVFGDYLLTDTGTGPSLRTLSVYDLTAGERILSEGYYQPEELSLIPPTSISYWRGSDVGPTVESCNGYNEIVEQSFTPQIIVQVERNLVTNAEVVSESRCIATQ